MLALLLLAGCEPSSTVEKADTLPTGDDPRLQAAITAAREYFRGDLEASPEAYLFLDDFYHWFGVAEFDDMPGRFDRALRSASLRQWPPDSRRHPGYLRVHRRLIRVQRINPGGAQRWEEFATDLLERGDTSSLIVPALYCDQVPFPSNYASMLQKGVAAGGLELTHVGLALMWIEENGCSAPVDEGFTAKVATLIAEIPNADERVTDLELEAAAFAIYMRRTDLVRSEFVEALLAAQRHDGGWSIDSAYASLASNWHPSVFALWVLLELREPGRATGRMIPQAD